MNHFIFKRSSKLFTLAIFLTSILSTSLANAQEIKPTSVLQQLAVLEMTSGGELGISAINTANHQQIQYRADQRFPLESTFKLLGVSAILKQSMKNKNLLQQRLTYQQNDVLPWSPITKQNVATGMTIFDLSAAAMQYSDSTATNLLMQKLGGPKAVTAFARSIGDSAFTLDGKTRLHPMSTPAAMENSLQQLVLGNVLAPTQREQLVNWMTSNTTGDARIRAGIPANWIVADKTGSGNHGVTNDIAVIWPPNCAPLVVAIYFIQDKKNATRRPDVVAEAARILVDGFAQNDPCLAS